MLLSRVKWREVIEPLMWSLLMIKVDPCHSRSQKLHQRIIGATISNSQLEDADKAFRMLLSVGVPARLMESTKPFCKSKERVWTAPYCLRLFAMPNAARHLKSHRLNRIGDQIGSHVII